MSGLFENYDVHICRETELAELQAFISEYWKKNHALSVSAELMNWQHYDRKRKCYNFVIAQHKLTNEIHGLLGFIPAEHFDEHMPSDSLWLAMWKVREDIKAAGLGVYLYYYLENLRKPKTTIAVGINPKVLPLYNFLKFSTGTLHHWYLPNRSKRDFQLIGNFDGQYGSLESAPESNSRLQEIFQEDLANLENTAGEFQNPLQRPAKSVKFLLKRYLLHPVYHYQIFASLESEKIRGLFVMRKVSHKGCHALRIVEYLGSENGWLGLEDGFQKLLAEYDAEYADCYSYGLSPDVLSRSGFLERKAASSVVVPNYFEPFEQKNVNLIFGYKPSDAGNVFIYKGDADQDRPNAILQGALK